MTSLAAITSVALPTLVSLSSPEDDNLSALADAPDWIDPSGGGDLGGGADVSFVRAPTRLCYHRFSVGETVYVLSASTGGHIRSRVRGVYAHGSNVFYDFGIGRLVPEQHVVSVEDHRVQVAHRARVIKKEAERQLSQLRDAPFDLLPSNRRRS